jgi:hypothetical protein
LPGSRFLKASCTDFLSNDFIEARSLTGGLFDGEGGAEAPATKPNIDGSRPGELEGISLITALTGSSRLSVFKELWLPALVKNCGLGGGCPGSVNGAREPDPALPSGSAEREGEGGFGIAIDPALFGTCEAQGEGDAI